MFSKINDCFENITDEPIVFAHFFIDLPCVFIICDRTGKNQALVATGDFGAIFFCWRLIFENKTNLGPNYYRQHKN